MSVVIQNSGGQRRLSLAALKSTPRTVALAVRLLWRSSRATFLGAAALQAVSGAGVAVQLLVGRKLLTVVLHTDLGATGIGSVAPWLGVLVAVTTVVGLAGTAASFLQRLLTEQSMKQVQGQVLDAAGSVDLVTFESSEFFDRLQRAGTQGVMAPLQISMNLLGLIAAAAGLVGIVLALSSIAAILLPIILIGYLPAWYAATANSAAMVNFSFGQTANDRARQALQRVLTGRPGAAEVRAFGLAPLLRERWDGMFDERIHEARKVALSRLRRSSTAGVASSLLTAGVYLALIWMLMTGRVDVAGAATAALGIQQIGSRLHGLTGGMSTIYESSQFLDDSLSFFDRVYEAAAHDGAGPAAPQGFACLHVDGVGFSYPGTDRMALRAVDVEINAGEVVALVGENGSGKTTLAKILAGLYRPAVGVVRWDDTDLRDVDPASIREHVAVTFQDFQRYPLDGWENVGIGRPSAIADRARIRAAADHAGATPYLEDLHAGFDTLLSKEFEGGEDLSVGQWQRLALARAFFRDAPFIILDEPTAALDPRAEYELFQAIRELFSGRTVLLISHRFSSVRAADRIYVLEQGAVIEHGTHQELMAAAGTYAELFTMQADAYLDKADDAAEAPRRLLLAPGMTAGELPSEILAKLPPEIRAKLVP